MRRIATCRIYFKPESLADGCFFCITVVIGFDSKSKVLAENDSERRVCEVK